MSATDADLRQAEQFVRELVEQSEGAVASVSCTSPEGLGAKCEVVLADGRTATAVVERQGRGGAYFMRPRRGDAIKPIAPTDLIFMPDYGADPLWSADGGMVPLDRLPIGDSLRARIRAWASRWDDLTYQAWNYDEDGLAAIGSSPKHSLSEIRSRAKSNHAARARRTADAAPSITERKTRPLKLRPARLPFLG